MSNSSKFLVTVGYTKLAFDDREAAMKLYALLTESTPVKTFWLGSECTVPESLKNIDFVREDRDVEIELKRVDANKFAIQFTEEEFKAKCMLQPTEVDGEARVVEETPILAAPAEAMIVEVQDDDPF